MTFSFRAYIGASIIIAMLALDQIIATDIKTAQLIPFYAGVGCQESEYESLSAATPDKAAVQISIAPGRGIGSFHIYFENFNLPKDDYVLVRPMHVYSTSSNSLKISGVAKPQQFISGSITGDGVIVGLYRKSRGNAVTASCNGFTITGYIFTPFNVREIASLPVTNINSHLRSLPVNVSSHTKEPDVVTNVTEFHHALQNMDESVCGSDESKEAACYEASEITGVAKEVSLLMYTTSRAVARLAIRRDGIVGYCTGFLIGCEGHILTNQHCIRNTEDAFNTKIEFFAEAGTCDSASKCEVRGSCPGAVSTVSTTLIATSEKLDYALVKIDSNTLSYVGSYLQLRASGPTTDDAIYIPQYPMGWGKRIASTNNGAPGKIESLTASPCGGEDAGYSVDTQEGSSGSPVISVTDHLVVALHHCGGCMNGGIPSNKLLEDFQKKGIMPRCAYQ